MERLYFLRIGGTAMGGVAGALKLAGYEVAGSEEQLYEPMKSYLEGLAVPVFRAFAPENLASFQPDRVVVGNAVSRGNEELEVALDHRLPLVSLPQLVGERLIGMHQSVVIAGTHGKTTTTALTSWLLEVGGLKPGFLIGGVPGNFDVSCRPSGGGPFVCEGDEYDCAYWDKRSKFMHYRPDVAVVNNLEFDHADIFRDLNEIKESFRLFIRLVPRNGLVLANGDDANVNDLRQHAVSPWETFGLGPDNDWRIEPADSGPRVSYRGQTELTLDSELPGDFMLRNALAAIVVAKRFGVPDEALRSGVGSFVPPKRRMEVLGTWRGATLIDDFGHHPTAIRQTLRAVARQYPARRIVAVFEPRSNTTTRRLLQRELEACFEGASVVGIGALDRPWRYSAEERLDTRGLVESLERKGIESFAVDPEASRESGWGLEMRDWLAQVVRSEDVLIVFTNGDFGGLRTQLSQEVETGRIGNP